MQHEGNRFGLAGSRVCFLALLCGWGLVYVLPAFGVTSGALDPELLEDPRARFIAEYKSDQTAQTGGQVRTVGSLMSCDYQDLQAAIDGANDGDELRLMDETFVGNYYTGKGLKLIGGFQDCTSDSRSGRTRLDGNGVGTTLRITGPLEITVELERLRITNGSATGNGGGIHIKGGGREIVLSNVQVDQNHSDGDGGGIRIQDAPGTALYLLDLSVVVNNSAGGNGGGIACNMGGESSNAWVIFDRGQINDNQGVNGGGVYADNCLMASHAGGLLQGIVGNQASQGGGIFATGGSIVGLIGDSPGFMVPGDPDYPAHVVDNVSDNNGGGVYLDGTETSLLAVDAVISGNEAGFEGGGVYVTGGASAKIERIAQTDCSGIRCSQLKLNSAGLAGAAIRVESGHVELFKTYVHNNGVPEGDIIDGIGGAALVGGTGPASLVTEGIVVHDNSGGTIFHASGAEATIELAWSTLADNQARSAVVGASADGVVDLNSSIVWEDQPTVPLAQVSGSGSGSVNGDCLVAFELDTLSSHVVSIEADPEFVDPVGADYHLQSSSPAVDKCNDFYLPSLTDIDNEPRGVRYHDDSVSPWLFDAGADELQSDVLFRDRFEQP